MSCCCQVTSAPEANVALTSLLRHVAPSVPQIPHDMALDMLRQAYIEFARRTSMLEYCHEFHAQKGVKEYRLDVPTGYEMFALKSPEEGRGIPPFDIVYPTPDRWYFGWGRRFRIESAQGSQWLIYREAPTTDCERHKRKLRLSIIPNECVDSMPQEIATPYGKGIAAGAKAEAFGMPKQSWSDAQAQRRFELEFNRTVLAGKNLMLTNRGARAPMFRPVRIL